MINIKVPATSANLGSGFDSLGIALTMYNYISIEQSDDIHITSTDGKAVPRTESNLIYKTAKHLFELCGAPVTSFKIVQTNNIPMARGLGSSSACLVGGLMGANAMLNYPLNKNDLINLAASLEGHPDNTTPAILGGLVTCAMDNDQVYNVSVPVATKVRFAALIPKMPLQTDHARSVLPQQVTRDDAVFNLSRAALMASSLFSGKLENLKVATQDKIHQPYRLNLIPGADVAFNICNELGAYGFYLSGAGSTLMAIIDYDNNNFELNIRTLLAQNGITDWSVKILSADTKGAQYI